MMNRVTEVLNNIPAPIAGALLSTVIAIFRVIYDKEETKPIRVLMEACICGGLTVSVSHAIKALGLDTNWVMFAGGVIGYIGSNKVRDIAIWSFRRKVLGNERDED